MQTLYLESRFQRTLRTKKALKEAVKAGKQVYVYSESIHGDGSAPDGRNTLCGPEPYVRNWYAEITTKDGVILTVK